MIFDPILDFFRGKAVTVPPMDGAFRPNRRLDEARLVAGLAMPMDIALRNGDLLVASGNAVYRISESGGAGEIAVAFPAQVSALAVSPAGQTAVALEGGELSIDGKVIDLPKEIGCITALCFSGDETLYIANGSRTTTALDWKRDLMAKGKSGSVWSLGLKGGTARAIASGLAWPQGIITDGGTLVVSESWHRRLLRIDAAGSSKQVLGNIPGYPGRLSATPTGALLSVFAPVNRLIEFVLQEDDYRHDMMAEIDPAFWIAPSLSSGRSFLEPLQCGGIKTMGIHKPWAPSRSYGLLARLDRNFQPVESYHSRSDGKRHGIFGAVEQNGSVYTASAGGDCILAIDNQERA